MRFEKRIEDEIDDNGSIGCVVRYYDRKNDCHIEARVVEIIERHF